MSALNIAAYGEGIMYPPNLAPNISAIQQAGWNTIILGLFHISSSGDIGFNDTSIIQGGKYVGDSTWPGQLTQLKSGNISTLLASIGGGGVSDYENIMTIYQSNNNSFQGTALQSNFQTFRNTFTAVSIIDMDCEDNYDQPSFVAFCEMLIEMGFGITFCPYTYDSFWTGSLAAIQAQYPGAVKWWNLQCYDGGNGNDPADWAASIQQAIPGFDTNGYILASDWSRFWNTQYKIWEGDCPQAVQSLLSQFKGEACVGGAFIWTLDQILDYAATEKQHPDAHSCGSVGMSDYVNAMVAALS